MLLLGVSEDAAALYRLVGERVRKARKRLGISQEDLAKRLGKTRTSIVNIEAGRQRPPVHVLWSIATHLKTEIALLLPSTSDFDRHMEPIELDPQTIHAIENAANGNAITRQSLVAFIGQAKSRTEDS